MSEVIYLLTEPDVQAAADAVASEVSRAPLQDVVETVRRAVAEYIAANAFRAERPGGVRSSAPVVTRPHLSGIAADTADDSNNATEPEAKKYHVRKGGTDRYPDIVLAEIPEDEFEAGEVWERLQPLVRSDSERAFESFRRSLDKDPRFERIGADGWRFRRVPERRYPKPWEALDLGDNEETADRAGTRATVFDL